MRDVIRRPLSLIAEFLRLEAAAGLLLMAAAALALVVANSPAAPIYRAALSADIGLPVASLSLLHWINDGLMAIYFLLVGLEIKRELLAGELSSVKRAALPGIAALGGMLVPALIYVAFNWNAPATLRGWAIPAATDIAFALGVLALLGSRVPTSLKVFLTALAILDDLGAILIIAVFYTADLSLTALGLAAAGLSVLFAFNRFGVRHLAPYLVVGGLVWCAVLASGIHATLAGVALALLIPLRTEGQGEERAPLHRLEHGLHPWVAYGILPVFGLANAGLSLEGLSLAAFLTPVPLGVAAGLLVGKQLGVMGASWLAVSRGWAQWPEGANRWQIYGVAVLCGIGFTMSLFIGGLAFASDALQDQVKLGVFSGSAIAAVLGFLVLRLSAARKS
jgi:NhaA family Na+:H+ antiporter